MVDPPLDAEPFQPTQMPIADGAALYDLACRLHVQTYYGIVAGGELQLLAGEIPAKLPLGLAVPSGAVVIGSRVARAGDHTTIVLEAPGSQGDLYGFYRMQLLAAGWQFAATSVERAPRPDGNEADGRNAGREDDPQRQDAYLLTGSGPAVRIHTEPARPGTTEVWIEVGLGAAEMPEGVPRLERLRGLGGWFLGLAPVPGGERVFVGGSHHFGRDNDVSAVMHHTSAESAVRVHGRYGEQLARAGWSPLRAGHDGALTWSTWVVPDAGNPKPYYACLSVIRLSWRDREFRIALEAVWATPGHRPAWLRAEECPWADGLSQMTQQPGAVRGADTASERLLTLFEHLESPMVGRAQEPEAAYTRQVARLVGGEEARELVAALPIPPHSRMVGGSTTPLAQGREWITVVLLTGLAPADIATFYHQELQAAGWRQEPEQDQFPSPSSAWASGFVDFRDLAGGEYVHPELGLACFATLGVAGDGQTEVHLHLHSFDPDHLDSLPLGDGPPAMRHGVFPTLVVPAGGSLDPLLRKGGGWRRFFDYATLYIAGDLAAIAAHYHAQLARSGWILRAAAIDGAQSWSTWSVPRAAQDTATGRLRITRSPFAPDTYSLELTDLPVEDRRWG